jgi:hypothetical protein
MQKLIIGIGDCALGWNQSRLQVMPEQFASYKRTLRVYRVGATEKADHGPPVKCSP